MTDPYPTPSPTYPEAQDVFTTKKFDSPANPVVYGYDRCTGYAYDQTWEAGELRVLKHGCRRNAEV